MTTLPEDPEIIAAAQWLADQKEPPSLAVPVLRDKFSLSAVQACEAIRLARNYRLVRRVFG